MNIDIEMYAKIIGAQFLNIGDCTMLPLRISGVTHSRYFLKLLSPSGNHQVSGFLILHHIYIAPTLALPHFFQDIVYQFRSIYQGVVNRIVIKLLQ